MVESDGLVVLDETATTVAPGDAVTFVPFAELLY
jgi:molybdopterin biosynthesis enzyme